MIKELVGLVTIAAVGSVFVYLYLSVILLIAGLAFVQGKLRVFTPESNLR